MSETGNKRGPEVVKMSEQGKKIAAGTILQILPDADVRENFRGCLAVVDEASDGRILAYVSSIDRPGKVAFLRLDPKGTAEDFIVVGYTPVKWEFKVDE